MPETTAKGVKGFFLYSPVTKNFFFRVYDPEPGPDGRKTFKDYRICADDIEVELLDDYLSLHDGEQPRLDYNSKVLGKKVDKP